MLKAQLLPEQYHHLVTSFGEQLKVGVPLARYTAARLGGPADLFLKVETLDDLEQAVTICWDQNIPFVLLGGGSNVLISDAGVRGLVILNRARKVNFSTKSNAPFVWVESGANFGLIARQAAKHGLSGLEWAAGIPGTVGGAVVGNAGAHGADMAGNLLLAEILHHIELDQGTSWSHEKWPVEKMEYSYRSSRLKRGAGQYIVLSAKLGLQTGSVEEVNARIDEMAAYRKRTQPPGASMGSMFKNPPGDYAGRLIEAAGLKGKRRGNVSISPVHANFFVNDGHASALDVYSLIQLAQNEVRQQFHIDLELEIDLVGDWPQDVIHE